VTEVLLEPSQKVGALSFLRITAWATYDLANTIFSINIVSLYFPLWVIQDHHGTDLLYAAFASGSIFIASLFMPFLGTLSDHLQKRMVFLIPTTLLCIGATACLSRSNSLTGGLIFFAIANCGYQLGLLFYDSLLPEIGSEKIMGRVSGFGVTLGYLGTLIGLALVRPFVLAKGHQAAFLPTAIFFLLFSLPCFCFVRDRKRPSLPTAGFSLYQATSERFQKGFSHFKKGSPLRQFASVHFFSLLAIQPVILFMSIYTQKVIGLDDDQMIVFFFLTTCFAILGSFAAGFLTDRLGAWKIFALSLAGWVIGFSCAIVAREKWHFWISGGLIGMVLGSTWVSGRVLVIRFSPPEHIGEVFGCLGLVGRLAAILGPLGWGAIIWGFNAFFPWNYRLALLCLLVCMLISLSLFLKKVPKDLF